VTLGIIILRSLRQHGVPTTMTALGIALGAGLLFAVWTLQREARAAFDAVAGEFDAVLGARGSPLQLVLNAVFHLESSPGNLPWADVEEVRQHPAVRRAIPIAVGDNYLGYRLVGTVPEMFSDPNTSAGSWVVRQPGRFFDPMRREAVVGSFAARKLRLRLGDTFHPYHGLVFDERQRHAERYTVVGILEPTGTPADRVLWIPLAGIQNMSGHDPSSATEVSAVLLKLTSPAVGFQLDLVYNRRGNRLTFAWPTARIVSDLFARISWVDRVLGLVAWLVGLVATLGVFTSLYGSMTQRRRDIAILRALGAPKRTVFGAVMGEAIAVSGIGTLLGFGVAALVLQLAGTVIRAQTGVVIQAWPDPAALLVGLVIFLILGGLAGLVPAVQAYRTPVADYLAPTS
jgi:putative ABC transport system permease protein